MEFWPTDFKVDSSTSSKKTRKGKEVSRLNGQSIEPGGLGSATLIFGEGLPQWIAAVQPNSRYLPQSVGQPAEVFPPTKPPPINMPKLTIQQRAEQGARFLRTYHPDLDIAVDLIRDALWLDQKHAAVDSALDPYAGNRLISLYMETKRKQLTPFLAFSCGVTGSELNVSPFRLTRNKRYIFSPCATPTMSFDTPIQQIVTFLSKQLTFQNISLLAVRTHAVVSVLKLQSTSSLDVAEPPVAAETVVPISISETGKRRVVDMSTCSFSSSNPQILLVNEMGMLYNYQMPPWGKELSSFSDTLVKDDDGLDRFWRLAWKDTHSYIRASGKVVHMFDLRMQDTQPHELFCLGDVREYVTSLEAPSDGSHSICFATTRRLLWYDDRNSKRPVLSVMHQRSFDRSLRVESINLGLSTLTTLSSSINHLVTVYDANYSSSGHFKVHGAPALLPGSSALDLPILGSLVFQPTGERDHDHSHFQLSSRGSLWKTNVIFPSEVALESSDDSPNGFEWTDEMHALGEKGRTMTEDIGTLGGREHIIVDLRGIYEKIYNVHDQTQVPDEDAEAVYQTLEKMPLFWQDMDAPTEHMFTTFDVAFRSGSESVHASRADFLTESLLNTTRGFMALIQGRIPIPRLVIKASWSHDMTTLPSAMVPNMLTPSLALYNTLREKALAQAVTPQGMQRATEATQNLVLDLALSRHVYAPPSISKTRMNGSEEVDGAEMLSRATKALSLGATEPPPLQFGFLRPMIKVAVKDPEYMEIEDKLNNDERLEIPWGIRLLLSHWDVGSTPEDYSYNDPYTGKNVSLPGQIPTTGRTEGHAFVVSTQQASIPAIITAPRPPTVVSSLPRQISTQTGSFMDSQMPLGLYLSCQPPDSFTDNEVSGRETHRNIWLDSDKSPYELPGSSTQPLSGPFGGGNRLLGTGKKVGKKRMGGF